VPWFLARDVLNVLGIKDTGSSAINAVNPGDKQRRNLGLRGQEPWLVNEAGLYTLVLMSKKPEAKDFQAWVTSEVLPAIRKNGGYMTTDVAKLAMSDPEAFMAQAYLMATRRL